MLELVFTHVRSRVLASIAVEKLPKFTFFVFIILLGESVLTFFAYRHIFVLLGPSSY